jgi:hypothetical protein
MVELKEVRQAELKEQKQRNREDKGRLHKYAQEILKLQRRFLTLATTQGYRIPDANDIHVVSIDSSSGDSFKSAHNREQQELRLQDNRDSEEQLMPAQRRESAVCKRRGKDQATRLWEAGLMPVVDASRHDLGIPFGF